MSYHIYSTTNRKYKDFDREADTPTFATIEEAKAFIADDIKADLEDFQRMLKNPTDRKEYTTADEYGNYEPFASYDFVNDNGDVEDSVFVDWPFYLVSRYEDFEAFTDYEFIEPSTTDEDGDIEYWTPDGMDHVIYPKEDMEAYCKSKGVEPEDIDASDFEEPANHELMDLLQELHDRWISDLKYWK